MFSVSLDLIFVYYFYSSTQNYTKSAAGCDYSLFIAGIKPIDLRNPSRGRWLISLVKKPRTTEPALYWLEVISTTLNVCYISLRHLSFNGYFMFRFCA